MQISNSLVFFHKSRCKQCGTEPKAVYYLMDRIPVKDHIVSIAIDNWFAEFSPKPHYLTSHLNPRQIKTVNGYAVTIKQCSYSPSYHKGEKNKIGRFIECYVCKCGVKEWQMMEAKTSVAKSKRAIATYPTKIVEW